MKKKPVIDFDMNVRLQSDVKMSKKDYKELLDDVSKFFRLKYYNVKSVGIWHIVGDGSTYHA